MGQAVLRQVAGACPGGFRDRAVVGLVEARQDAEHRGLARAVGTAQADTLAVGHLPGHVVEENARDPNDFVRFES